MTAFLVCVGLLVPATAACLYYFALTTLGWKARGKKLDQAPKNSFVIVIPAHNEELGIGHTIATIRASDYPRELVDILVVADNCIDGTVKAAQTAGALAVERHDATLRGKGYALAFGIPFALASGRSALLIADADCDFLPNTLREIDSLLCSGAKVVQTSVVSRNPEVEPAGIVSMVGSTIENAISAGLDRLGYSAALRGTGMAFQREVLEAHPWNSFGVTEDAEYGVTLARAGIRVRFSSEAEIRTETPPSIAALRKQRQRWRAALFEDGVGLVRKLTASKPLVLLELFLALFAVALCIGLGSFSQGWQFFFVGWSSLLVVLTSLVYLRAMHHCGVTVNSFKSLSSIVIVVASLGWITISGLIRRTTVWERTPRVLETAGK